MADWQSVRNPPQTVGLVRYRDVGIEVEFMAQWDGRMFRHASGLLAGSVVIQMHGDQWRSTEGEKE